MPKASPDRATEHSIEIEGSEKPVKFEVELVPYDSLPSSLRAENETNIARVDVGGKPFAVVLGKTVSA
jgi:hypothetical protein